jgi:hypothetical protein
LLADIDPPRSPRFLAATCWTRSACDTS